LDIQGRQRQRQFELAKKYKISFPSPGGGCLLCEKEFSAKLKDLFRHEKSISSRDIELLKLGRHFRINNSRVIIGRDYGENIKIKKLAGKDDLLLEAEDIPSPTTLVKGKADKKTIEKAAEVTARYSDAKTSHVLIRILPGKQEITVKKADEQEIEKFRIIAN
jgi:hypothetical protein